MPELRRQRVEVAIIARNAASTLGATIASVAVFASRVVLVLDTSTTDQTAKVARRAARANGLKIEIIPRAWTDHFGEARDASFQHLDPTADWWLWIDADDTVQGADKVQTLLGSLDPMPEYGCVWLPYDYSHDERGRVATTFSRERFLRPSVGWKWRHRVHEVLQPQTPTQHTYAADVRIVHQPHDATGSPARNLALLLRQLQDEPGTFDPLRTEREIGEAYLALGRFDEAALYFERVTESQHDIYPWWAWLKLSHLERARGNALASKGAALNAFALHPEWAESTLELAYACNKLGEYEQTLSHCARFQAWDRRPDAPEATRVLMSEPPHLVFRCPLDYTHHWRYAMAEAYGNLGRAEDGLRVMWPVRHTSKLTWADTRRFAAAARERRRAIRYTEGALADQDALVVAPPTPDILIFPPVRDAWFPRILRARHTPDVTIHCGHTVEEWAPPALDEGGIGGSETAVVEIARRLCAEGRRVEVFGRPGRWEGVHDGVGYWDASRYDASRVGDFFVGWRQPRGAALAAGAWARVAWLHDLNYGPDDQAVPVGQDYDRVLAVSAWHAGYLQRAYPGLDPARVGFVPNGVNLERFQGTEDRAIHRCVWSSSPDRGLEALLRMWPTIKEKVEDAELHVFYGWAGIDHEIRRGAPGMAEFKRVLVDAMARLPGVVWRGRVGQNELAREMMRADALAYSATFLETNCIGVQEAMAARCVPVVTDPVHGGGALLEAIGDAGLVVPGNAGNPRTQYHYVGHLLAVLLDPAMRAVLQARGVERVKGRTWDAAGLAWSALVDELLSGRTEVAA